jgi:D-lactate dehydrogenase (cytochrome)
LPPRADPPVVAERLAGVALPLLGQDPELLQSYLEDASGRPAGRARGVVRPQSEAEAAAFLRDSRERGLTVLPQAARTSLTGGAIPQGDVVLSVEMLRDVETIRRDPAGAGGTFGPGIRLRELQVRLAAEGLYFPPVPTYQEAMLGGAVATNAGGAATFKYGVTRDWVRGLRVLLFNGDRLVLERGQATAPRGGRFRIRLSDGSELAVPAPGYRLPALKKITAGYHSAEHLDLVDLFVGSEGTLGLITAVDLDLAPLPPAVVTGLVFLTRRQAALDLAGALRAAALRARSAGDPNGPDVRAIEWLDESCLDVLRLHGDARSRRVDLAADARAGLLFELELAEPMSDETAQAHLAAYLDGGPDDPDRGLIRLFAILDDHGALDRLQLAFPEDARRHRALTELREAVPQRVNELLARRRRDDPAVEKVGGDLIVPFERLREMLERFEEGFARRGLEHAVWGHLADGNLHPNAFPRSRSEVQAGFDALLEFADDAVRLGGCPLSEHGVGRNPVKQEMLRRFLGDGAIDEMRRIRKALDPQGRFAPGVLFPPDPRRP